MELKINFKINSAIPVAFEALFLHLEKICHYFCNIQIIL